MRFDKRLLIVPTLAAFSVPLLVTPEQDAVAAAQAPTPRGSLCAVGEQVIFSCGIGRKMVSVCGGRATAPHAQYRFGTPGNIELAFPGPGQSGLSYAREMYSGGGALQIRFATGGYDYAVYSRTVRTGFGRSGRNNPRFSDGVMVRRGDRLISNRACTTQVRADAQPEDFMPEGTMMDWFD
jgi:hypothetical protein